MKQRSSNNKPLSSSCGSPLLRLSVLGSGSKGNVAVVEGPDGAILIDAGFSAREICARLDALGILADSIDALVVTHEHTDHCSGVGVIARRLDIPVYATEGTLASPAFERAGVSERANRISAGESITLCGINVMPFATSHDARESIGFRFEHDAKDTIGYMTDTGIVTEQALEMLSDVRILALESNHDINMLTTGPYPYVLKQRIKSDHGHLSNAQAADALKQLASDKLTHVIAMHLSETNNLPLHSDKALREALHEIGHDAKVQSTGQHRPRACGDKPKEKRKGIHKD